MRWQGLGISQQLIQVGLLLVRRVPSSSAMQSARHKHYWRGYLFPLSRPIESLGQVGKLIEVRTSQEFDAACEAYRASMEPGEDTRLTYYEVIDASAEG